jgi:putative transposase
MINTKSVGTGRDLSLPTIVESSLPTKTKIKPLSDIIGAFKTTSSKDIHLAGFLNFFWQRSFYERIIRSEEEVCKIRQYIMNNPANWDNDDENPGKK